MEGLQLRIRANLNGINEIAVRVPAGKHMAGFKLLELVMPEIAELNDSLQIGGLLDRYREKIRHKSVKPVDALIEAERRDRERLQQKATEHREECTMQEQVRP